MRWKKEKQKSAFSNISGTSITANLTTRDLADVGEACEVRDQRTVGKQFAEIAAYLKGENWVES